jgi:protein MpaA
VPADRTFTWIRVGSILIVASFLAAGLRPAIAEELAETVIGREATESAGTNVPAVKMQPSPQPTASPPAARRVLLGHSALGRSIFAFELGDPSSRTTMLVVGCIHGDECAGIAIARSLISAPPPRGIDLWVVPDLNPDGFGAGTRQNGRGVDLNRNFPYRWRPLGQPGSLNYSGTGPLSEPEARIASRLIARVRPRVSIWFHQPLGLVDLSGGDAAVEWRFARLVGLPRVRLPRYPGSVATWQNHRFPFTTAFVVELPAGSLSPTAADRYADAVLRLEP